MAYAPVSDPARVTVLGPLQTGPAWSTSKVALSIAALLEPTSRTAANVRAAITVSDNAAARALWDQLGGDVPAAAEAVDAVLAAHGDTRTRTPSRSPRPEFSPYGMTVWTLSQQVRFVAGVSCSRSPVDREVFGHMGRIDPSQRWGLGRLDGSAFKGGWGPGTDGVYLARQMGVVTLHGVPTAVAIAARPGDGTFDAATVNLSALAAWLKDHAEVNRSTGRACGP